MRMGGGGFPGDSTVKYPPALKGLGFDPWVGKIPWRGNGNPRHCSCLGNPIDRGAWRATVHGVARVRTQLRLHPHKNGSRAEVSSGLKSSPKGL